MIRSVHAHCETRSSGLRRTGAGPGLGRGGSRPRRARAQCACALGLRGVHPVTSWPRTCCRSSSGYLVRLVAQVTDARLKSATRPQWERSKFWLSNLLFRCACRSLCFLPQEHHLSNHFTFQSLTIGLKRTSAALRLVALRWSDCCTLPRLPIRRLQATPAGVASVPTAPISTTSGLDGARPVVHAGGLG